MVSGGAPRVKRNRPAASFAPPMEDAIRRGVAVDAVSAYRPPEYWMDFYAVATYRPDLLRAGAEERLRLFVDEVVSQGPQPPPEVRLHAAVGGPPMYAMRR